MAEKKNLQNEIKENKPKSKWLFIAGLLFVLWLASMIIAGLISLYFGANYDIEPGISRGNLAVIPIKGEISTESTGTFFFQEGTVSEKTVEFIKAADRDSSIKAMLFE